MTIELNEQGEPLHVFYVVCERRKCPRNGEVRAVPAQRIADGIWTMPPAICECNIDRPDYVEMRRVSKL